MEHEYGIKQLTHQLKKSGAVDDHFMDALRYSMSMRERPKNGIERAKEILYGKQGQKVVK